MDQPPLTPFQRLMGLLSNEKRDIYYIYLYAIVVGLISLSLPLGIQAIINLISGGMVFSSVYLLIGLVIAGVLVSGILQIIQITLVEVLQRRVFAKAAFEFTYRIPHIRTEALAEYYPPELMNRFFDILSVQKALPKLLIDITAAVLQIIFGLILLSFYHPFFIVFGLIVVLLIIGMIYLIGPKGLETSLKESKYKYKVAQWLEDIARTLRTFKHAGDSPLPVQKMDGLVQNYLAYRKKHFSVLVGFFGNAVAFKTLVTAGLLILGTLLVVDRQITLGQFVASELIIVLVVGSVEKLIQNVDVVFDLLTAVEKLGTVTDLPLEKEQGFVLVTDESKTAGQHANSLLVRDALTLKVTDLNYSYESGGAPVLKNINFELQPHERICLTGSGDSGKHTLTSLLAAERNGYEGSITFNGFSLRDLQAGSLRQLIGRNSLHDALFDGTILENITLDRPGINPADVQWALNALGLTEAVNHLPDGLQTMMLSGNHQISESLSIRIVLARCVVHRPRILMLTDTLSVLDKSERLQVLSFLTDKANPWSLLIVSNDPIVMAACDRVLMLDKGQIIETRTNHA
ncbi:peptidase domain-containing ABC transporter [Tellurirhabdus rosea]|uniref:peptidase domain-containing ABC transporter n=1 Tax=Tellurirhabdus rosea TaxID=2674997 RepID=UPI0022527F0A|nr:ABC transporter transmembrane domain-containing protein [Tellurirhabdus rosea]